MKYFYFKNCFSTIREKGQLILILVAFVSFFACTNDNEENLNPEHPCDTIPTTYSGVVQPILEANCYGCHSGNSPRGDVLLDNYEDVRDLAIDGRLQGTINYEPGYSPMPQRQPQLDSCKLHYIDVWVEQGAPNN